MVRCQILLDAMERIAPRRLAEEWDNPGLLVGNPQQEIHRVYVCLDVSEAVVDRAMEAGCDMIVSHHPLIFKPMKKFRTDFTLGRILQKLMKADIAVFAAHTNLDIVQGGVNDVLARKIGLSELAPFVLTEPIGQRAPFAPASLGRIGVLAEPLPVDAFARQVKEGLSADHVRLVRAGTSLVHKVALCSGSGAEFIAKAAFCGADAYVTGDVKYHDAQRAAELGLHLIDAGHFPTEFPVVPVLASRLEEEIRKVKQAVEIVTDEVSQDFFQLIR